MDELKNLFCQHYSSFLKFLIIYLFLFLFIYLFIFFYVHLSSYFYLERLQKKHTSLRVLGFYNQVRKANEINKTKLLSHCKISDFMLQFKLTLTY